MKGFPPKAKSFWNNGTYQNLKGGGGEFPPCTTVGGMTLGVRPRVKFCNHDDEDNVEKNNWFCEQTLFSTYYNVKPPNSTSTYDSTYDNEFSFIFFNLDKVK